MLHQEGDGLGLTERAHPSGAGAPVRGAATAAGRRDHQAVSATFLPKAHIDALVTAALHWAEPDGFRYRRLMTMRMLTLTAANADRVGGMLWRANYDHTEGWAPPEERRVAEMPTYAFEPLPGVPDPVVVLRAISCYRYQTAGDPEDFEVTEAYGFLDWLTQTAVHHLPGWGSLPWVIEDRDVFLNR